MSGIYLWGSGIEGIAEPTTPLDMQRYSAGGAFDISDLGPWSEVAIIGDNPQEKSWVSEKAWPGPQIFLTGPCSSTLDLARYFCQKGFWPEWASIIAPAQWAGRGQFHRSWYSPVGNLYAAWRIPKPVSAGLANLISLLVGYLVVHCLIDLGVKNVQLKWPNDLLLNNQKIGGLLIEERGQVIIAGLGINLTTTPDQIHLSNDYAYPASSLEICGYSFKVLTLWKNIVRMGKSNYSAITEGMTALSFISYIESHLALLGKEVTIRVPNREHPIQARIIGLDQSGGLIIHTAGKELVIHSGSIVAPGSIGCSSSHLIAKK